MALEEDEALKAIFQPIRAAVKEAHCNRAIMVAHNAHFDLGFVNTAVTRNNIKRNPFHSFSCFDTATLAGLAYGQTVLAKACDVAEIKFNNDKAHSAAYDAEKQLNCSAALSIDGRTWAAGIDKVHNPLQNSTKPSTQTNLLKQESVS